VFPAFVSSHEVHRQSPSNVVLSIMTAERLRPVPEVFVFPVPFAASATLIAMSMRLVWGARARLYLPQILLQVATGAMLTLSAPSMKSAPIITVFDAKLENV